MAGKQMKKFYVLSTDKALNAEQKEYVREWWDKDKYSTLPMLLLDRGFQLSLVDEDKSTISNVYNSKNPKKL